TGLLGRDVNPTDNGSSFHRLPLRLLVRGVALERTGQRELAELVTDHVLVDVNGNVLAAVVHSDRQADKLGQDRGTARPGFDRLLVFALGSRVRLLGEVGIANRAFLDLSCHSVRLLLALAPLDDLVVRPLVATGLEPLRGRAPRADRFACLAGTAFAATVRVVHRVHGHATNRRTHTAPTHRTGLADLAQAVFFVTDF